MTYNTQPKEKKDCAIKSAVLIYEDFQNLKPIDVSSNLMNFRLFLLEIFPVFFLLGECKTSNLLSVKGSLFMCRASVYYN